jgi:GT2 family glycosyltransferase
VDISVVIPTRNRLESLKVTLAALARQELEDLVAEVVVVDNGSDDGTPEWLCERARTFPFGLRAFTESAAGVSVARNRGVEEARGRLVLSINDDTSPADSDLVAGHVWAHAQTTDSIAVLGRIVYPASERANDPFMAWLSRGAQFDFDSLEQGREPLPNHYYTAHLSFGRDRFRAVGGMDERLVFGFEDAEFGFRMSQGGTTLSYQPQLVLLHRHSMDPGSWRAHRERMGAAAALVNRVHRTKPPIADPARGPYWRGLSLVDTALQRVPTDWRSAPAPLRKAAYGIMNNGAYARGYRRAERVHARGAQTSRS